MQQPISLQEMLAAREARAFLQSQLLATYHAPLISFTMNIAGPIKNSPLIREGFLLGLSQLLEALNAAKISILFQKETSSPAGNEVFLVTDAPEHLIKQITCDLEDGSDLGRLFDMDVIRSDGSKVEREELGLSPRRCLICSGPARICARSRAHSVPELQERTTVLLTDGIKDADAKEAARLAGQALLYEVATTPKPGLVDRFNSGSHSDMDIFTFLTSASSLWSYFEECTRIGRESAPLPAPETFARIRRSGRQAEARMFAATGGVNTHKGAIFSVGIVCAALGRLSRADWGDAERVLDECAAMTAGIVERDFGNLTPDQAKTGGQKLYLAYGIEGIRGQVAAGFPAVRNVGLPILKKGVAQGRSLNDSGCAALLALITSDDDTNLIARGGRETQLAVVSELKELLSVTPFPDTETLRRLDEMFIEKNLSPGGSADLLAICYLLYFLESSSALSVFSQGRSTSVRPK